MADLEDIARKQKEAAELGKKLARTTDVAEIKRLAKEIAEKAKEVEAAAKSMAEAATPKGLPNVGGEVRVVLTPDQRQRVVAQTGVGLDTLVITQDAAQWMVRMPGMQKRFIEQMALRQAAESVAREARDKATRKLIKDLEPHAGASPHVQRVVDQLREDPEKLGELLKEMAKETKAAAKANEELKPKEE